MSDTLPRQINAKSTFNLRLTNNECLTFVTSHWKSVYYVLQVSDTSHRDC